MDLRLASERAARGAAVLDRARPGWFKKIDLNTLSLGSCLNCVLGQVFTVEARSNQPFLFGLVVLGLEPSTQARVTKESTAAIAAHGFGGFGTQDDVGLDSLSAEVSMVQSAWVTEIVTRLARTEVVAAPPEQPDTEVVNA